MRNRYPLTTIAAATLIAAGGILAYNAPGAAGATVTVHEDEAGWNCYTMGNGDCGEDLKRVTRPRDGVRGMVLPVANDNKVYVSWKDGKVTRATGAQRKAAWTKCIRLAWYHGELTVSTRNVCNADYGYARTPRH